MQPAQGLHSLARGFTDVGFADMGISDGYVSIIGNPYAARNCQREVKRLSKIIDKQIDDYPKIEAVAKLKLKQVKKLVSADQTRFNVDLEEALRAHYLERGWGSFQIYDRPDYNLHDYFNARLAR